MAGIKSRQQETFFWLKRTHTYIYISIYVQIYLYSRQTEFFERNLGGNPRKHFNRLFDFRQTALEWKSVQI